MSAILAGTLVLKNPTTGASIFSRPTLQSNTSVPTLRASMRRDGKSRKSAVNVASPIVTPAKPLHKPADLSFLPEIHDPHIMSTAQKA